MAAHNHTMQRMRASRLTQSQFGSPWLLARTADGDRWGTSAAMKTLFTLLAVSLLLTGCERRDGANGNPADPEASKRLVGVWSLHRDYLQGGSCDSLTTVRPGGHYLSEMTVGRSNGVVKFEFEGNLELKDGMLVDTITRDTQTNAASVPR